MLKRLALLVPGIRRLHADRQRHIEEVARLKSQIARLDAAMAVLVRERDRIADGRAESAEARGRRLYVVGFARTGTTILMDILNSSPEVFMFSELHLHILRRFPNGFDNVVGAGFLEQYLERKLREHPTYKSSALPLPGGESATVQVDPDAYLDRLGRTYRHVGDKIAIAHIPVNGVDHVDLLNDFLRAESQATLILTLRKASEILTSYRKMFPGADLREAALSVARTGMLLVRRFLETNRAYLIFHDDIGPGLIAEFQDLLGTRHDISPKLIGSSFQKSRGAADIPFTLRNWVAELDRCHDRLHGIWNCDATILKRSRTAGLVLDVERVLGDIDALVRNPPAA